MNIHCSKFIEYIYNNSIIAIYFTYQVTITTTQSLKTKLIITLYIIFCCFFLSSVSYVVESSLSSICFFSFELFLCSLLNQLNYVSVFDFCL